MARQNNEEIEFKWKKWQRLNYIEDSK